MAKPETKQVEMPRSPSGTANTEERLALIRKQVREIFDAPAKEAPENVKAILEAVQNLPVHGVLQASLGDDFTLPEAGKWGSYKAKKGKSAGHYIWTSSGRFDSTHDIMAIGDRRLVANVSFAILPVSK